MALKVSNVIRPAVHENLFLQTLIQPKRVIWMILILIFYQRIITRVSNYCLKLWFRIPPHYYWPKKRWKLCRVADMPWRPSPQEFTELFSLVNKRGRNWMSWRLNWTQFAAVNSHQGEVKHKIDDDDISSLQGSRQRVVKKTLFQRFSD